MYCKFQKYLDRKYWLEVVSEKGYLTKDLCEGEGEIQVCI